MSDAKMRKWASAGKPHSTQTAAGEFTERENSSGPVSQLQTRTG